MERQLCNLEDDTMSKQTERDAFRSRWGFILACIGSAVGMGNIWRFPYLVSAWGGMTFLLPYFLFVLLIGSTGIIGEMALGRSTRSGPIGAFGQAAALRGRRSTGEAVGYIPVLGSLALAIGYTCVMGWIFKYTFLAFDGGLSAMGQDMDGHGWDRRHLQCHGQRVGRECLGRRRGRGELCHHVLRHRRRH